MIDLVSVIEEFEAVTREELDFTVEANNTREFIEKCIEDETQISCPRIIDELSTEKILTMTYVDGYSISEKERIKSEGYDVEDVGARIVNNYVHQVLDAGVFHADPHQGNIMFANGIPYWIDFGMIGRISEANINMVSKIVLGVIQGDAEDIVTAAMSMGTASAKTDSNKLMKDVDSFMNKYMTGTSIEDVDVDEMFTSFSDLAAANYITLPSEFTMLLRSLIMIEGVIEELCPALNLFQLLSDKFMERAKKNFDLKKSLLEAGQEALSMGKKATRIPMLIADALKDVVKGNMKINLELMGYDSLMNSLSIMIRNIILAIFSCVIFTGSCVLCMTEIGPSTKSGMPLISAVGFLFSIALGIYSVRQMSRKR
jgi:ubiquinone biosynthesis protein